MNIPIITVLSDDSAPGYQKLRETASKHNWTLISLKTDWKGFSTKLITTYEFVKENNIADFIFCDAFDVLFFGDCEEFLMKFKSYGFDRNAIVASAERGLWPPTLEVFRKEYPTNSHGFNFINSGLYYANSATFMDIFERNTPEYTTDDQEWMNCMWINGERIQIDHNQMLFNSHSHISPGEYGYENGRIQIFDNQPIAVHKNGRTVDEKLDALV